MYSMYFYANDPRIMDLNISQLYLFAQMVLEKGKLMVFSKYIGLYFLVS
jgi:hypothetical protein